ncbi:MAG: hypothetical protein OXI25_06775 [Chloroflexota bacterium]|nr:hypothetical protein [Chloroflexota bacterium]
MISKIDDREKLIRDKSRQAVSLAMECRWEEAVDVNEELLDLTPSNVEASNRLGRAYLEMGDCARARTAFERTLRHAPDNAIARKNLDRLDGIASVYGANAPAAPPTRVSSSSFIGDSGKTARITLPHRSSALLSVGAPVTLRAEGSGVLIEYPTGEVIGAAPPNLGVRMARLMAGGNRYMGVLVASSSDGVTVLLRETHQAPSQRNIVSFPVTEQVEEDEEHTVASAPDVNSEAANEPEPAAGGAESEAMLEAVETEAEVDAFFVAMGGDGAEEAQGTAHAPDSLESAAAAELDALHGDEQEDG